MATLQNVQDTSLQSSTLRRNTPVLTLSAPAAAFIKPKNGAATTPTNITITATPNEIFTTAVTYKWEYALGSDPATYTTLTPVTATLTVTPAAVVALVTGKTDRVYYRCTATEGVTTASSIFIVTYTVEANDPITIDLNRNSISMPSDQYGTVSSFASSGVTIKVTRGSSLLTYNSAQADAVNSFRVEANADATRTLGGTANSTSTSYVLDGITALTADQSSIIYTIKVYDAVATLTDTFSRTVTYTKVKNGLVGNDASFYYISLNTQVIAKSSSSATISGTHTPSSIIATGKRILGSGSPTDYGYISIQPSTGSEPAVSQNTQTVTILNTSAATSYTVRLYNDANKTVLLDTETIPVVYTGSDGAPGSAGAAAISAVLSNDNVSIPTDSAGDNAVYTNSGTEISVYEGATALTYQPTGTPAAGSWKVTAAGANITAGAITAKSGSTTVAVAAAAGSITADTATVTYTIQAVNAANQTVNITKTQSLKKLRAGSIGVDGKKSIVLNCYLWATAEPTIPTQAFTYTWATGLVSLYPTGWTASAPAAPGNGYTLYQLNVTISAAAGDTTTSANWSTSTRNIIGFRKDGTIGELSAFTKTAYITLATATPPATPAATTGAASLPAAVGGVSWTSASPGTVADGSYVYISTGIYGETSNQVVWAAPYLSYFKVGSLSAISASMGAVGISNTGNIHSGTGGSGDPAKGYADGNSGFFLGYSTNKYKFDVGTASSYLRFDGDKVSATGINIYTEDNQDILVLAGGLDWFPTGSIKQYSALSLQKTGTANATDTWAYSKQFFARGAYLTFQTAAINKQFAAGLTLSTNPGADSAIKYAIQLNTDGKVLAFANGVQVSQLATTHTLTNVFTITYDNTSIYYYIDNVLKYTQTASVPVDASFVAKVAFTTTLSYITGIKFGSYSSPGQSAYDAAVLAGFVGTQAQWILSLNGTDGETGAAGTRAAVTYVLAGYESLTSAAQSDATTWFTTNYGGKILGDRLTVYYAATGKGKTYSWTGSQWQEVSAYIDGNLLVSGSISSDALALNLITVGSRIVSQDGLFIVDMQDKYISISV